MRTTKETKRPSESLLTFLKQRYEHSKNKHHQEVFIFTPYISTYSDVFIFLIYISLFLDM
ncbi:hypothetical protein BLMD_01245 [Bacillus paralicheniformis]|nr:hypothetical protein BLMD_01245 [Bacillus paralicheniformis]AYQ14799.1 hypothetical protein D5285_01185 [Bacillus paralicheniformis]PAE02809.1 hypothetical protein CHI13_15750 [Bacillus paralicheniformis]QFY40397.1 hypothetical protein D2B33_19320 [Bacillus paralicheniformis]TJW24605.1 hypothetical protein E7L52_17070 [Bacillus paralicheniformis]